MPEPLSPEHLREISTRQVDGLLWAHGVRDRVTLTLEERDALVAMARSSLVPDSGRMRTMLLNISEHVRTILTLEQQAHLGIGAGVELDYCVLRAFTELAELMSSSGASGTAARPAETTLEAEARYGRFVKAAALDDSLTDTEARNVARFLSNRPLDEHDIARTHELAAKYGWKRAEPPGAPPPADIRPTVELLRLGERAARWFADGTRTDESLDVDTALKCIDAALGALESQPAAQCGDDALVAWLRELKTWAEEERKLAFERTRKPGANQAVHEEARAAFAWMVTKIDLILADRLAARPGETAKE